LLPLDLYIERFVIINVEIYNVDADDKVVFTKTLEACECSWLGSH